MKRTLLVASLALISATGAFAQSNVTIYGRLNMTVESEKFGNASRTTAVNNNASRIGFKGSEDLGGGLKAGFVLEHGFNPDTGGASSSRFWARESTVFIGGGFGKIQLGNAAASESYFATVDYISMHNHDTGSSSEDLAAFVSTGALQNSISYYSPNLGGFNFAAQYGVKEGAQVDNPIALAANYDAGPLHLGLGVEKNGSAKSIGLRALYELGAFTLGGLYERGTGTYSSDEPAPPNGRAGTSAKGNLFRVAGMYTMGASEFHVNVGHLSGADNVTRRNGNQWTLGYNYNLSKRTKVYTYYTDKNVTGSTADYNSLAVGVRHNF